ncbi:hypothetical protein MMC25_008234 [Agyrium rufum]|nr:hypothetical protein [Agyrium rufum]
MPQLQDPIVSPLRVRNNSNDSNVPYSTTTTSSLANGHNLRRKGSHRHLPSSAYDSSDFSPSPHSSIYEAPYYSPPSVSKENISIRTSSLGQTKRTFVTGGRRNSASSETLEAAALPGEGCVARPTSPLSLRTGLPNRSIHLPTPLETIIERKSFATLRLRRSASLKGRRRSFLSYRTSSKSLLRKRKSKELTPGPGTENTSVSHAAPRHGDDVLDTLEDAVHERMSRRKKSFSVNDVTIRRHLSRYFFKSSTDSYTPSIASLNGVTPYSTQRFPVMPHTSPPHRVPTPPGLPTFNTEAAANYRLPPPPIRLRDMFRFTSTPEEAEWTTQTLGLPRGAIMRGTDGTLVKGRWRPGQSGQTGTHLNAGEIKKRRGALFTIERVQERLGGSNGRTDASTTQPNVTVATDVSVTRQLTAPMPQLVSQGLPLATEEEAARSGDTRNQDGLRMHPHPSHPTDPQSIHPAASAAVAHRPCACQSQNQPISLDTPSPRPQQAIPYFPRYYAQQKKEADKDTGFFAFVSEFLCLVCCGAEKADDGLFHPCVAPNVDLNIRHRQSARGYWDGA